MSLRITYLLESWLKLLWLVVGPFPLTHSLRLPGSDKDIKLDDFAPISSRLGIFYIKRVYNGDISESETVRWHIQQAPGNWKDWIEAIVGPTNRRRGQGSLVLLDNPSEVFGNEACSIRM